MRAGSVCGGTPVTRCCCWKVCPLTAFNSSAPAHFDSKRVKKQQETVTNLENNDNNFKKSNDFWKNGIVHHFPPCFSQSSEISETAKCAWQRGRWEEGLISRCASGVVFRVTAWWLKLNRRARALGSVLGLQPTGLLASSLTCLSVCMSQNALCR